MPIIKNKDFVYYLTIKELVNLQITKRLIMYRDSASRNTEYLESEKEEIIDFIKKKHNSNVSFFTNNIDFEGTEASCAATELIIFSSYFLNTNLKIRGTHKTIDMTSNYVFLKDIRYPFNSWNVEAILYDLIIESGNFYYQIRLSEIERIIGSYPSFKVFLKDFTLFFDRGWITVQPKEQTYKELKCDTSGFEIYKPAKRLLSKKEMKNYNSFSLYVNDNYLYSNKSHTRFYSTFEDYKQSNIDLF